MGHLQLTDEDYFAVVYGLEPGAPPMSRLPYVLVPNPAVQETQERLVRQWGLAPELACKLIALRDYMACTFPAPVTFMVTSGKREASEYYHDGTRWRLIQGDYPAADPSLSTHVPAPTGPYAGYSQGVDVDLIPETDETRRWFGTAAGAVGLRWGGGSEVDSRTGIPTDWRHVDLGRKVR